MKESDLAARFRSEFLKIFPGALYHKIGDFPGGSLRPFDAFAIWDGDFFCFEFKVRHGRLLPHQQYFLALAKSNGAKTFVVRTGEYAKVLGHLKKFKEEKNHGTS